MTDEVFDLDAVAAEAESRKFVFKYGGREWTMLHINDFDWRILTSGSLTGDAEALDAAFRKGLGVAQYEQFRELDQSVRVAKALFDAWLEFCGLTPGKSESSTDSSESTEKPSKPASKRTTRSASAGSSRARSRPAASSS